MINIFREWISDIKFQNKDEKLNELFLTIPVTQMCSDLDSLFEAEDAPAAPAAPVKSMKECPMSIFNPDNLKIHKSVPQGEPIELTRDMDAQVLEILIREKGITIEKLYQTMDKFFAALNLGRKVMAFDSMVTAATGSIKSVCKVLVQDLLDHYQEKLDYIEFKLIYRSEDNEVVLELRHPGDQYNPFVNNAEGRGIKVLNRQNCVTSFYTYKNKINKHIVILEIVN